MEPFKFISGRLAIIGSYIQNALRKDDESMAFVLKIKGVFRHQLIIRAPLINALKKTCDNNWPDFLRNTG
jgi:hypothetical protein